MRRGVVASMRVAVVSYHSSPLHEPGSGDAGGMTIYVRELAEALAQRGVRTDIFTRATETGPRVTELLDGVRVVAIEAGPVQLLAKEQLAAHIADFVAGIRAFSTSQRISYDVLHSHYWQSGLAAKALGEAWSIPLVHSNHTLGKVKNRSLPPGDPPEPLARIVGEGSVFAAGDILVASSDEEWQQLSCLYGASHDRLKVVHPGVDHDLFFPGDRRRARAALGLEADAPVFLYVGRIQPLKGIDLAIRSLAVVRGRWERDPLLIVVGGASGHNGGGEVERLRELTADLGIADRVRFIGPRRHDELPAFYRAANAVVVCSHSESFGFAALEAHASGIPVVGTAVGGLSHIVRDGRSGYLVRSRDPETFASKLSAIAQDDERAEAFSTAALRSAAAFSWDKTAEQFVDLYECLVREESPEVCTC